MNQLELEKWSSIAFSPRVMKRSATYAIVVGFMLILINHGACFWDGTFSSICFLQSLLSTVVPYIVVTISSVQTTLSNEKSA